jgi:hypothetical protein
LWHRVPDSSKAFVTCEGGTAFSMLPGFRFLFAAIVLTTSILVFGLGAAALLRAAHEEFASLPSWHPGGEPAFAQPGESSPPILAMLRVEPATEEQKAPDNLPAAAVPAEAEQKDAALPETAEPDVPSANDPEQDKAPPAQADVQTAAAGTDEIKIAAKEEVSSSPNEAAPAVTERPNVAEEVNAPAAPEITSTQVAALTTSPITGKIPLPPVRASVVKPDKKVVPKPRRKIVSRPRPVQPAPQQTVDSFGPPPVTPARAR